MENHESNEDRLEQSEDALTKNLSRREFLKIAGIAGASVGVAGGLGTLIAACGGEEETTTTAGATTTTAGG
ncbi:MAG TPA: twin-arginine translocation signal domain-containing protein, partial [Thermoleophilia bacterium]|nr:twin-arginine translocation signal domain-containing protein [Thermoleophilia bacterium]